ncbi:MAG: zinc-binding alcohol dehydrogenase [Pseudomonadota bacterium]
MDKAAQALVYTGPGTAEIAAIDPGPRPEGHVTVRTRYSALSRGTERLVFEGRVPEAEYGRMRAPHQVGDFPFPVRYGYAAVGEVIAGPDSLLGRDVFSLVPHQSVFHVPEAAAIAVPDDVPAPRAVLAANMETALNAIWDAEVSPGIRCLVVGAGLVGWLITAGLARRKDLMIALTDVRPESGINAADFRVNFMSPDEIAPQSFDIVFHTSASAAGLQTAIDALDFEGTVIELSWYGDCPVEVSLGGNFHANRLKLISSQVGHVAAPRRAAMDYRGRLTRAMAALEDARLDALITQEVAFTNLPREIARLLGPGAPGIATRIVYD